MKTALQKLKEGNLRFIQQKPLKRILQEEFKKNTSQQKPIATILTCIDSRVLPNLIFDQGIGELMVCRVAGNVVNEDIIASIEFACTSLETEHLLILGHTKCRAIQAATEGVKFGHVTQLFDKITPGITHCKLHYDSPGLEQITHQHTLHSLKEIQQQSPLLQELIKKNKLQASCAIYDVDTGKVDFL